MDRAERLRAFVESAQLGSFSAAARKLQLTRDQVSKYVAALEEELRAPLFARSTRSLKLTTAGEALLERAINIVAMMDDVLSTIGTMRSAPRGQLRINAPMSFGLQHLSPLIGKFHAQFPEISLRIELDDRFVDPARSGADVTIRIAHLPPELDLVARPLAVAERVLVASPAYLRSFGTPKQPADLSQHECLHYGDLAQGVPWHFSRKHDTYTHTARGSVCSNNGDVLRDAALSGVGTTVLPRFIVHDLVERGELIELLSDWEVTPSIAVYALYSQASRAFPAVKAFVEFAQAEISAHPALQPYPGRAVATSAERTTKSRPRAKRTIEKHVRKARK